DQGVMIGRSVGTRGGGADGRGPSCACPLHKATRHGGQAQGPHIRPTSPLVPTNLVGLMCSFDVGAMNCAPTHYPCRTESCLYDAHYPVCLWFTWRCTTAYCAGSRFTGRRA